MKLNYKLFVGVVFLFFCFKTEAQKLKSLKNINWLVGKWESEAKKGNIYEEWKLVDDMKMEGRGYKVYKRDTSNWATMDISMDGTDIYYTVTVKDRNSGAPVRFKMTDGNTMHMTFENKEHDFPQIIKYQWKQNNHFNVEVSGLVKGKMKKQIYIYKKIK